MGDGESGKSGGARDHMMVRVPWEMWERLRALGRSMAEGLSPGIPGPATAAVARTALDRGIEALELEEQRRRRAVAR